MPQPDSPMSELMAHAANSRAEMWRLCGQIAARPTPEFVEELRDGTVIRRIERATEWTGESFDAKEITGPLVAFRNRSDRFSAEQDLAELVDEWERNTRDDEICEIFADEERQASAEADAWRDDDPDAAKASRAAQFQGLQPRLERAMAWCQRVHDASQLLVLRSLIRVVVSHLGIEGGRDLLTAFDDPNRRLQFG